MIPLRRTAQALALAHLLAPATHAAAPEPPPTPQTRSYETSDLNRAQRLAIAALQDLGFALESADAEQGTITASRLDTHALRLSVAILAASESAITATVTTDYAGTPSSDARPAEAFFAAFERQLAPLPAID